MNRVRPECVVRIVVLGLVVAALSGKPAGAAGFGIPMIHEIILDLVRGPAVPLDTDDLIREYERRVKEPGAGEFDHLILGVAHCEKARLLGQKRPSGGDLVRIEGHHRRALQAFRAAASTNPASAEAHGWMGLVHSVLADHSNAVLCADSSVRLGPTNWSTWCKRGTVFDNAGRTPEAIEAYTTAIRLQPNALDPHLSLARLYDRAGRPGDVVAVCGNAAARGPPAAEIVDVESKALVALGRADEAVRLCRACLGHSPKNPQIQYRLAQALAALGNFDEAVQLQLAVKAAEPGRCDPYNEIGVYLWRQGRLDAACREYRRGLAVHKSCPMISRNLAIALLQMNQPAEAIAVLEEAWAVHPKTLEVCAPLADAYGALGRTDKAEATCRRGIAIDPLAPEPRLTLARLLLDLGSLEESVVHSRKGLERDPHNVAGWQNLGAALLRLRLFGEAAKAFRQGAEGNGGQIDLWVYAVNALREGGRLDDALECSRAATQRIPTNAALWGVMGDLHVLRGEPARAVEAYLNALNMGSNAPLISIIPHADRWPALLEAHRQASRASPTNMMFRADLATALAAAGNAAEARKVLEEGLALRPDDIWLLERQGLTMLDERRFAKAAAVFERCLKIDPRIARIRFNLGHAYMEMGRKDLAIPHWEIVAQTDRSVPDAHERLGLAMAEAGRYREALGLFRRYVEAVPADASGHCSVGYTCYKLGMYDEALVALARSIALDPNAGIVHYDLALVLHEKGRNREAVACCEKARVLGYPGNPAFVQKVRDAAAREATSVGP